MLPIEVFDLLRNQRAGALGEIQLTDALQGLAGRHGMMGLILKPVALTPVIPRAFDRWPPLRPRPRQRAVCGAHAELERSV